MAFTDKGTISNNALAIAFATENPVKAKIASSYLLVTFTTDLADGAEGSLLLTYDSVTPATGGSAQSSLKEIKWPANVRWEAGNGGTNPQGFVTPSNAPKPRGIVGDVAHFKFIRDNAAGIYIGRLVVSGGS
jgi:hypothetical protein